CCARAVSGIAARTALVNARKSRRFIAIAHSQGVRRVDRTDLDPDPSMGRIVAMSALGQKQTCVQRKKPCPLYPRKQTLRRGQVALGVDHQVLGRQAQGLQRRIAFNFSPKLFRSSDLPSSFYRKLRANSVALDSKIWRCAWPR